MSEIVLRGLRAADRPAIARILSEVGVFREVEIAIGLELVDETLNPGPATDYLWKVATRDGEVIGFACYGPVPLTEGTFDLYWIAVSPRAQGSSAARMLDEAVTRDARNRGGRWLLAETSSMPGYARTHRFYQRQGYDQVGRIPDFYRVGDDRITFGKRLDDEATRIQD